ncbi:MAG: lamin tail domain-containing protein, partial [Myxococcota bacterium]
MVRSALVLLPLLLAACGNDNSLKRNNTPPSVAITAPADGEVFRQGAGLLLLTGVVADTYDDPADLTVTLTVGTDAPAPVVPDAEGLVSAELSVDALALGPLTLVLAATDSDGDYAEASVIVDVQGPIGAPTVTITAPADGAAYVWGDAVTFRGTATDLTTAAGDLTFAWSSDLDGPLPDAVSGDGASALFTEGLSVGTHVVTLTATDLDGEIGADTVTVVIEEEVVVPEPGDLVFSEMMVNPQIVEDEVGEWVELYNTSGSTLDITGYSFRDDDVDLQILEGPLLVAPHDFVVLCANMDPRQNGGVPCDGHFERISTGGGLALANGPDELVLARPDGVEIDWLHYDDTWYTLGVALGLDPDELDDTVNDDPAYWCDQTTLVAPMVEPGTP